MQIHKIASTAKSQVRISSAHNKDKKFQMIGKLTKDPFYEDKLYASCMYNIVYGIATITTGELNSLLFLSFRWTILGYMWIPS